MIGEAEPTMTRPKTQRTPIRAARVVAVGSWDGWSHRPGRRRRMVSLDAPRRSDRSGGTDRTGGDASSAGTGRSWGTDAVAAATGGRVWWGTAPTPPGGAGRAEGWRARLRSRVEVRTGLTATAPSVGPLR